MRQDNNAAGVGRSHIILDVPWLRLQEHERRVAPRNGLDVDGALVSLRHSGANAARLAMEADTGACRRTSEAVGEHIFDIHLIRRKPPGAANRRVYTLRSAEEIRWGVVSEGIGNCSDGTGHRLTFGAHSHRGDAVVPDESVQHVLQQDRDKHGLAARTVLAGGLCSDRCVRHRRVAANTHTAEEAVCI